MARYENMEVLREELGKEIKARKVLGFNPYSQEYTCFMADITPEKAEYILKNNNNDNRKIARGQVRILSSSIEDDGWLEDGSPMSFNVEGNLTEFQHRLESIIETEVTARVPIVLGVQLDCFTKCATNKQRKPEDEIQRKDPNAIQSEVTTLRQILSRRRGSGLTMQNAVEKWVYWKPYVVKGTKMVDSFFENTKCFGSWKRIFQAWAALMITKNQEQIVEDFLSLLEVQILRPSEGCVLTTGFMKFWADNNTFLNGTETAELLWQLLCVATDRMKKNSTGQIEFSLTVAKCNHESLKKRGTYRDFLENPDDITLVGELPSDF